MSETEARERAFTDEEILRTPGKFKRNTVFNLAYTFMESALGERYPNLEGEREKNSDFPNEAIFRDAPTTTTGPFFWRKTIKGRELARLDYHCKKLSLTIYLNERGVVEAGEELKEASPDARVSYWF